MKILKTKFGGVVWMFMAWSATAHPPSALVIDQQQTNVYFAYWGGTWKIDANDKLERVHSNDLDNPLAEWPHEGRPRIRRLSRDGQIQVLAEMKKVPSKKP